MTGAQILMLPSATRRKVRQPALSGAVVMATLSEVRSARAECAAIQEKINEHHIFMDGYQCAMNLNLRELEQAKARAMRAALGEIK